LTGSRALQFDDFRQSVTVGERPDRAIQTITDAIVRVVLA
jgi:hypothetical protein